MSRKYFGTDGIRGLANGLITPELALKVGQAAGLVRLARREHRGPLDAAEAPPHDARRTVGRPPGRGLRDRESVLLHHANRYDKKGS